MHEHSIENVKQFQLVELGPGRGTLMKDILRVSHFCLTLRQIVLKTFQQILRQRKYSEENLSIALYEASPLMRRRQTETLLNQSVCSPSFIPCYSSPLSLIQ